MDSKTFFKKYGAWLAAAILFAAAAIIYCFPILEGKVVLSTDDINARCAAEESYAYRQETGHTTWWNGSMFCGMPNYQINGGQYKADRLLSPLKNVLQRGHKNPIWAILIYLVCFYILMRAFGVGAWLSIGGAFALAFSTYFITIVGAGHNTKASTIALMGVVLAGFQLIFRKKYVLGAILAMVFTAVGFAAHPQMSYYIFLLIGVLWIAYLVDHIRSRKMKEFCVATALFAGAVLIGVGANSANVFANAEYLSESIRGGYSDLVQEQDDNASQGLDGKYAAEWSYGLMESFSFLIPGVQGGTSMHHFGTDSRLYKTLVRNKVDAKTARKFCDMVPLYWGDQMFTSGNVYMGAVVCFLFLLGILIVRGALKWGLLTATLFSMALALGNNCAWLNRLFMDWFPFFNKFRSVSSILIVAEITMPLLGFLAVKALVDGSVPEKKAGRSILVAAGITGVICLFFLLFGRSFDFTAKGDTHLKESADFVYKAVLDERRHLLLHDSLRSLALILASAAPLWLLSRKKLKAGWVIAMLGILVILDLWPVNRRYFGKELFIKKQDNEAAFEMQPYEKRLLKDPTLFRVLNLTRDPYSEARTSLYLQSVGGYSAAKLRRYQDLIAYHLTKLHAPVFGMLNAKYVLVKDKTTGETRIQSNEYALGNAWFVEKLYVAKDARQECDALMKIDLRKTAVIDQSFVDKAGNLDPGISPDATIRLSAFTPDTRDYDYSSSTPGTVVFSEIYYPHGWKVTVDGILTDHFRANYVLRAMNVPAGKHHIRFVFDPDSVRKGDTIALIFISLMYLLVAAAAAWGIFRLIKKK